MPQNSLHTTPSSTVKEQREEQKTRAGTLDENKARHAITIGKPLPEVYAFWRNFENLPLFMKDLHSVRILGKNRSHWTVKLKSGRTAEWDARITAEVPDQMIAWTSEEGSEVSTRGAVYFEKAPRDLGTVVSLSMDYEVPGGKLTELFTFLTGEGPDTLIQTNLKRFKGLLETGEIATTEGQPSGREEVPASEMKH